VNPRIALLVSALLASACNRCASESAPPPAASASAVASATAAASAVAAAPKPPVTNHGVFDVDYEGTVGPSRIYVQLSRDETRGRYFYDQKQGFLELRGSRGSDGPLTLRESSSGKHTGTFVLEREAGAFRGNWESAGQKRKLPVSLRAIVRRPGEPVRLVERAVRGPRAAKEEAGFGWIDATTCGVAFEYYQVLGLADRKLQAELDARFRPPEPPDCVSPGMMSGGPRVHMNERGVLSVEYFWDYVLAGYARGEVVARGAVNALVDRGMVDVPVKRILDPARLPSIRRRLEQAIDASPHVRADDPLPEGIRDQLVDAVIHMPDVRLSAKGLVFCPAAGFGQALDALEGCQYVIPYDELAQVLLPESPASFVWKP
jgi:hypothetical protein